jgi:hypothetical protein
MTTEQPIPSAADAAASPAENGIDSAAAERDGDFSTLDEIAGVAMDLLRALHVETMDPWNAATCLPGERVRAGDPALAYSRLTRTVRVNLAVRARMAARVSDLPGSDGAGAALDRQAQGRMVGLMSSIGMDLLRTLQQEVVDPDNAPTARQGLRVGAGDPALALSRISRAIRLNLAIKARIAEGSLGRQRGSWARDPGRPAPLGPDPSRPGAGPAAATAAKSDKGASGPASSAEPDIETDGIEDETEDLFAELDEDFEEADEFAFLDKLSPEESMALLRRDVARCVKATARPRGAAAPAEPAEPTGCTEPPEPVRAAGGGQPTAPLSLRAMPGLAQPRTTRDPPPAVGGPGDDLPVNPAPPLHAHGRDPP